MFGQPRNRQRYLANILGLSDVIIEAVTDKTTAAGTSSVLWTAKTAAMIFRGGTSQMTGGDLETNYFEPSYGKLVYWANSNLVNGIEWMRYEWANKGSHGGEYVKGVFYLDTVETMNDAATLGTVLS